MGLRGHKGVSQLLLGVHIPTTAKAPAPVNSVAPVITYSLNQGDTATCSTGTWSNTPTSYHYQWYENGVLSGSDQNTYVPQGVGAFVYCAVAAWNATGFGLKNSATVGPITGGSLATPTLSNFSTLGAAPIVLQGSTADYVAGYRGQLQIATDSGFGTITQNIIFFIDGNSWASQDIGIGIVSPTGTYYARWRVLHDNESGTTVTGNDPLGNALSFGADIGPWSNTFTDTIVSSVAAFPSANGGDKNANIATSGTPKLSFLGANGVGAYCSTRVQVQAQSDLTQWEMTLTATGASDNVYMGVGTNGASFVGFAAPGLTDSNGAAVKIQANQITMNWNTDGTGATLSTTSGVAAISDVFALLLKKSTNQLSVFRTRSGVTVQIGTTQTIPAFASYYAYVSTRQAWGGTCNFGAAAFARALGGGEAIYG